MNSPLDDAMRELNSKRRAEVQLARRRKAERDRTNAAYKELIRDFLARIGTRGITTLIYPRRFKNTKGWRLVYWRDSEGSSSIFLTTDGRIVRRPGISDVYEEVSEFDFSGWGSNSLSTLSQSMAELLLPLADNGGHSRNVVPGQD